MRKVFLSISALLLCIISFTQVPESFNYQAIVRDGGDLLPNQLVSYQFSIIKGPLVKSTPLISTIYTEKHSVTTNQFGLVSLIIGTGTDKTGDFTLIDWGSDTYSLKVEIDVSGGSNYTEMGTTQLLSVPYALHAKSVTGAVNANNNTVTNVADPLNAQDAATKAYVDALEARLATLEEIVGGGDPITILTRSDSDDDATITLAIQSTIFNGSGSNFCEVRVIVRGDDVSLQAGDIVNVSLLEDDFTAPDLLWNTTHIVTAEEEVSQLVDIVYDCSTSLITIPAEMGDQLEIFATVDVVKDNCGTFCSQDSATTTNINVKVIN